MREPRSRERTAKTRTFVHMFDYGSLPRPLRNPMSGGQRVTALSAQGLVHDHHDHEACQQEPGEQRDADVLREQTEQRRHEHGTRVGERHLHTNDGLRLASPKYAGVE